MLNRGSGRRTCLHSLKFNKNTPTYFAVFSDYSTFSKGGVIIYHMDTTAPFLILQYYSFLLIQGIHKRMVRFQKLTRNLFLILHGHNVHRQQRQLSKFLMRYQQFASHAYCLTAGPVSKMASQQETLSVCSDLRCPDL